MGTAADPGPGRGGCSGAPHSDRRGLGASRRPGPRERRDAGVRPLPPRRRVRGAARQAAAGRAGGGRPRRPGRGVPVRIPGRGPARRGGGAAWGPADRPGHHHRPRTRGQHHRPGRRAHRRLARHQGVPVAAGWPGRPAGHQRGRGADRPGRPARHLPRPPPGDPAASGRGDRARSGESLRAGPAPVRGRRRAAADRGGSRAVRPGRRRRRRGPVPPVAAAPQAVRLVLDPPGARGPDDQPARDRRRARQDRGRDDRAAGRHGGRAVRARPGARRCHLSAPGRHLSGQHARPGRRGRAGRAGRPGLRDLRPAGDRYRGDRPAARDALGGRPGLLRGCRGHPAGHLLRPAPGRRRPDAGRDPAGLAAPYAAHPGDVVDGFRSAGRAACRRRSGSARGRARRRARLHRPAPAVRHLRSLGHWRGLHRPAPRDRAAHRICLRRARRGRRFRRARI